MEVCETKSEGLSRMYQVTVSKDDLAAKLEAKIAEAKAKGYQFIAYSADIADMADCDRFTQLLVENHGGVDFLINNAGRSIRRAIESGLTNFDLCRGDAEYKRHLGAAPTVCKKLRIVPPRLRSQVLNLAMTTGAAMKNWCHGKLPGTAQ